MKYDKIIFMDIDGVLNNNRQLMASHHMDEWDDDNFEEFIRIVSETNAKIVVSSSWRYDPRKMVLIQSRFSSRGFGDSIIGKVFPYLGDPVPRSLEIQVWLDENEVKKYAVVDDYMGACGEYHIGSFFKTDENIGMTKEIADSVINHLNGN